MTEQRAGHNPQNPAQLTLYTRAGCHLCEDMQYSLQELAPQHAFTIKPVDIDADPALREKFNLLVPALYLGATEVCHHFLDFAALQAALQQLTHSTSTGANRVE